MIGGGVALLLLSAAVGYWVLERANDQKKELKTVGQVVGYLIIVLSFIGVACKVYALSTGRWVGYCPAKSGCPAGFKCPFSGQGAQPPAGK